MILIYIIMFYSLNMFINCQVKSSFDQNRSKSLNNLILKGGGGKVVHDKVEFLVGRNTAIRIIRKKREISRIKYINNTTNILTQDFFESHYNPNQFIIYAPIKGKRVFTRIKYDNEASFNKKEGKTRRANKNINDKKKMIKGREKSSHFMTSTENLKLSKNEFIDDNNNELEYLTKSKGVIPIPRRPKINEEDKIFFIERILNKTKQVTLKKKVIEYGRRLTTTTTKTTTLKLPLKSLTKITPLSIINENQIIDNNNKKSFKTPDEVLSECCITKGISHDCQQICSFNEISDKTLVQAVLTNKCPNGELKEVFECATNGDDHTKCCFDQNVHLINNGQCMAFCSKTSAQITDILQYFMCLQVFEKIKSCYISNLNLLNNYRMSSNFKSKSFRLL